jgi:hypothetical protein
VWPELWIAVEAKSEQTADRLSMDYVLKANTQLDSLAADRDRRDDLQHRRKPGRRLRLSRRRSSPKQAATSRTLPAAHSDKVGAMTR